MTMFLPYVTTYHTEQKTVGVEGWLSGQRHLPHRPDDLSSIPGAHVKVEESRLYKMPPDFHTHAALCIMHAHANYKQSKL